MRRIHRPMVLRELIGAGGDPDPYFANVVLLLDASSRADGSTPSDLDVMGNTPLWRGGAQCKTDQAKFGTSSMYFDGTDDRIAFADSAAWAPGTGDYTVEMWAYAHAASGTGDRSLIGQSNVYNGFYPFGMRKSNLTTQMAVTDGVDIYGGYTGHTTASGQWVHYALVRDGQYLRTFVNGTMALTSSALAGKTLLDSTGNLAIGAYSDFDTVGSDWHGWIDQVRITKGVARYTADFSVPTELFPHY